VGASPAEAEVFISHVGEGYLSPNEIDLSCVGVNDKDIVSLEVKDLDKLVRLESRDHESERLFDRETVMSADLHDQAYMTGGITLIGEKGIECPEGKMSRQDGGTKDVNEKGSAMTVALAERKGPVNTEKVASLAGSPAIFCCFKESSFLVKNTDDKNALIVPQNASSLFHRRSDEPQEENHGEVSLEDENAEESWSLFEEESEFVADIALAKYALLEYPDPQAQSVSAGHPGGCVSFLYERNEGVSQSGDCATLHHEGDFNGNKLRRRVFDPEGLGLCFDYCRGCCIEESFSV